MGGERCWLGRRRRLGGIAVVAVAAVAVAVGGSDFVCDGPGWREGRSWYM